MITPKEYAALHEVAYTTVVNWLRPELIEGAQKIELPRMKSHVYVVPKDAKPPELKPGPKKGAKRSGAQSDQAAANGADTANDQADDESTPSKLKRPDRNPDSDLWLDYRDAAEANISTVPRNKSARWPPRRREPTNKSGC